MCNIWWRMTSCYCRAWKHSPNALARCTLFEKLDVFSLRVAVESSVAPANSSPVFHQKFPAPHQTRLPSRANQLATFGPYVAFTAECLGAWWVGNDMRRDRCVIFEVLSRHTWKEGGKSWRKRSHENRCVPAEVQIATFRVYVQGATCTLICSVPATVIHFLYCGAYLWHYIGRTTDCSPEIWYGCTYGRVSVFTCCRWYGEHYVGYINIKLDHW